MVRSNAVVMMWYGCPFWQGKRLLIDELFAHIDVDRSGSLSVDELHAFLSEISHLRRGHRNVSEEEVELAQVNVGGVFTPPGWGAGAPRDVQPLSV